MKKCDGCGEEFTGKSYPMHDENYHKIPGIILCEECYAATLGISAQAYQEAQEIDLEDLEAAADAFDRLKAGTYYDGYKESDFLENKQNDTKN